MESAPGDGAPGKSPRNGWRARLGMLGAVAAMCVIVGLIVVLLRPPGAGIGTVGVNPSGAAAPNEWQAYHDPLGLFSARLPATWTAHATTGTASYGDRTGSATETTEIVQFSDPALGAGSAGFEVSAEPIKSDFERHWYCQGFTRKNDTFHGIPTEHEYDALWLFDTANAHFQLNVDIPGVLGAPHSQPPQFGWHPTPTPLPAETVAADRATLSTILSAFQPTDATPLSCA
jgi:hypothetical protein